MGQVMRMADCTTLDGEPAVTALPGERPSIRQLVEEPGRARLHEVVTARARKSGKRYDDALGEVLALAGAERQLATLKARDDVIPGRLALHEQAATLACSRVGANYTAEDYEKALREVGS